VRFGASAGAMLLLYAFAATAPGLGAVARAEVYDDFDADAIDSGKWTHSSGPTFFSQSNGRLHFPCTYGASDSLVSTRSFPPGFFRLEFHDYTSTNHSPSGRGLGSFVAIVLGAGDEYVRTLRGNVARMGYFEANHIRGGGLLLLYQNAGAASGQLALHFDGSTVRYFFNVGLDPVEGWRQVGPSVTPKWTLAPRLSIRGHAGGSGCTSFSVDNVEFTPAPLPEPLSRALR
jgi:hypothetical protein